MTQGRPCLSDKSTLSAPSPNETHKSLLTYVTNLCNENSWPYFTFDNKIMPRYVKDFFLYLKILRWGKSLEPCFPGSKLLIFGLKKSDTIPL